MNQGLGVAQISDRETELYLPLNGSLFDPIIENLGFNFIISNVSKAFNFEILFQLLYVIDTTSQTYVEECINWQEKSTLIVSMTKPKLR